MPQLQLSNEELNAIDASLDASIASAERAQKTGKTPQIKEVYKLHEATLTELRAKIIKANAAVKT